MWGFSVQSKTNGANINYEAWSSDEQFTWYYLIFIRLQANLSLKIYLHRVFRFLQSFAIPRVVLSSRGFQTHYMWSSRVIWSPGFFQALKAVSLIWGNTKPIKEYRQINKINCDPNDHKKSSLYNPKFYNSAFASVKWFTFTKQFTYDYIYHQVSPKKSNSVNFPSKLVWKKNRLHIYSSKLRSNIGCDARIQKNLAFCAFLVMLTIKPPLGWLGFRMIPSSRSDYVTFFCVSLIPTCQNVFS